MKQVLHKAVSVSAVVTVTYEDGSKQTLDFNGFNFEDAPNYGMFFEHAPVYKDSGYHVLPGPTEISKEILELRIFGDAIPDENGAWLTVRDIEETP